MAPKAINSFLLPLNLIAIGWFSIACIFARTYQCTCMIRIAADDETHDHVTNAY
jgi:hypothetical protein